MDRNNRNPRNAESRSDEGAETAHVISIKQLQRLVRLLDRSDVSELELRRPGDGTRLVLRKVKASKPGDQQGMTSTPGAISAAPPPETKHTVISLLVGIFHGAAKPKGKPLVAVGDYVKVGQHVAAIESLNVINEVEAPAAGRIIELLVQEGQPVEYGQPLMTIDSAEGA